MKNLFLSALLVCFAAITSAQAKDVSCTGTNLIEKLRTEKPDEAKAIEVAAEKVPYGKGLLWKVVKDGGEPSYIFGTVHLSDPRLTTLPANAQSAFDASKTLALEITEILEPEKMAGKAFTLMKYTAYLDGSSLSDKMTAEQVEPVKKRLQEQAGLPWAAAKKMRPWVVMGSIALPACELARKQAGKPFLDMALGLAAKKQNKTVTALETMESQMATMASLSEEMMVKALVETAKMGDQLNDVFETMTALYLSQDTGMLWTMMRHVGPEGLQLDKQVSGYADFQKVVVDQRNATMADEAEKLIKNGSAFIALGALHLPGDKGILSILAQRGYQISPQ